MNKLLAVAIALAIPFSGAQAAVGTAFIAGQHEARAEKKENDLKAEKPIAVANDPFATTRFSYNVRVFRKDSTSDILNKTFYVLGRKTVKYESVESVPYILKATSKNNQPVEYEYEDYKVKNLIEITPIRADKSGILTKYTIALPVSELKLDRIQNEEGLSIDLPSDHTIGQDSMVFIPLGQPLHVGGIMTPTNGDPQIEITVKQM